jgi:hypothetical protein
MERVERNTLTKIQLFFNKIPQKSVCILAFFAYALHICWTSELGNQQNNLQVPHCATQKGKNVTMLGTVTPTPANMGLDFDDRG